jgi:hypothetical protein
MVQIAPPLPDCAALHPGYVLSQIGREEKAAAADKVSPIVRHRVSIAQQKVMGFATLNPSYGLRNDLPGHEVKFVGWAKARSAVPTSAPTQLQVSS